jgi:Domain of unknown function (DUF4279)
MIHLDHELPDRPRVSCELAVFSESVEADAVTTRVGVDPAETRRMGDARRSGKGRVKNHQWIWRPCSDVPRNLDSQLDALRAMAIERVEAFKALQNEARVVLEIVIEHYERALSLGWVLDRRHVELAAALGASLDVDEYDYTSP